MTALGFYVNKKKNKKLKDYRRKKILQEGFIQMHGNYFADKHKDMDGIKD